MLQRNLMLIFLGALTLSACSPILSNSNTQMRDQCQKGVQSACATYETAVKDCQSRLSPWTASWTRLNCEG
jgi:hypothetical protein